MGSGRARGGRPVGRASPACRRPLVGLAAAFLIGTWLGFRMEPGGGPALVAGLGLSLAAVAGRGRWATVALFAALACAGWARSAGRAERLSPVSIERRALRPEEFTRWIGVVATDPSVRTRESSLAQTSFRMRVEAARGLGWERARGTADVVLFGESETPPRYGDRIRVSGRIRQPDRLAGRPRLTASASSLQCLKTGCGSPWTEVGYRMRRKAQAILQLGLEDSPEEASVQTALLLGLRAGLSDELYAAFQRVGTFHIFAISGLHVVILFAFWAGALQLAGFSRDRWGIALLPLLWGYVLATGFAPSAVRAALMATCYILAAFAGRRPDSLSALAAAALLSVAVAPPQLADLGFIFSFTVVAGLLASGPFLAGLPEGFDPAGAARTQGLRTVWRMFTGALWVSAFAWIASTPLTAWSSSQISPASLVANLFTIPASTGIILSGCCSLLSGVFSPWLAEVFNHASRLMIQALNSATLALAEIPGSYLYVPRPSPGWVFGWFAAWAAALFLRGRLRLGVLAFLLAFGGISAYRQAPGSGLSSDTFSSGGVPVTVIRRPFHLTLVADPGPGFRAGGLLRELKARGINRVDVLLLRVPLLPWSSAARAVADDFPVREVWAPEAGWRFPAFRRLVEELAARGIPVRRLKAGDSWTLPDGEEVDVLHPSRESAGTARASALALRVAFREDAILLAGPVDSALAASLTACAADPAAPQLVAIHPAAESSAWDAVLDQIRPREVVAVLPGQAPWGAAEIEPLRSRNIRWTEILCEGR